MSVGGLPIGGVVIAMYDDPRKRTTSYVRYCAAFAHMPLQLKFFRMSAVVPLGHC